jgi:uncharacterized protein (TIGR02271 family)
MDSAQASQLLDQGVVVGSDGEEIGSVGQVFVDDTTNEPSWVTVKTGWFGAKESFVPLDAATVSGNRVTVPYDKDKIKGAPSHEVDQHLSPEEEAELYAYYGLGQGTAAVAETSTTDASYAQTTGTTTGVAAAGHDTSGPNTDDAMTRSEEQLHVGTQKVEAGRARLRKYIVTEQQTVNVPVTREEVRVEREPITDANRDQALSGGDLTEEEHEVVLTEERAVVQKETVPVERVRLGTETVTETQQVSADVRKEEIEFVEGQTTTGTDTTRS